MVVTKKTADSKDITQFKNKDLGINIHEEEDVHFDLGLNFDFEYELIHSKRIKKSFSITDETVNKLDKIHYLG